jgi:hypothetical protein
MESCNALAHRLIAASRANDWSTERFQALDQLTQTLITSHDRLAHGSFIAFRDFDLWNAWYRVWALGGFYSSLRYRRAHMHYRRTGDTRFLDELENHQYFGTPSPEVREYQDVFVSAYGIVVDVEAGRTTIAEAVPRIYALYRNKPWIPPGYKLDDPNQRFATPGDLKSHVKNSYWGYRRAPMEVRQRYFDFPATELVKEIVAAVVEEKSWVLRVRDAAQYPRFDRYRSATSPFNAMRQRALAAIPTALMKSAAMKMAGVMGSMNPMSTMATNPMPATGMNPMPAMGSMGGAGSMTTDMKDMKADNGHGTMNAAAEPTAGRKARTNEARNAGMTADAAEK